MTTSRPTGPPTNNAVTTKEWRTALDLVARFEETVDRRDPTAPGECLAQEYVVESKPEAAVKGAARLLAGCATATCSPRSTGICGVWPFISSSSTPTPSNIQTARILATRERRPEPLVDLGHHPRLEDRHVSHTPVVAF